MSLLLICPRMGIKQHFPLNNMNSTPPAKKTEPSNLASELKTTRKIQSSKFGSETEKSEVLRLAVRLEKSELQSSKFKVQRLAVRFRGGLGRSPIGVRCAFGNVYLRLICHELVQYFKVATFPFKDDCTPAHVLRSSATHFSIVIQDYTYLKKGFYRNCHTHEEVNLSLIHI